MSLVAALGLRSGPTTTAIGRARMIRLVGVLQSCVDEKGPPPAGPHVRLVASALKTQEPQPRRPGDSTIASGLVLRRRTDREPRPRGGLGSSNARPWNGRSLEGPSTKIRNVDGWVFKASPTYQASLARRSAVHRRGWRDLPLDVGSSVAAESKAVATNPLHARILDGAARGRCGSTGLQWLSSKERRARAERIVDPPVPNAGRPVTARR